MIKLLLIIILLIGGCASAPKTNKTFMVTGYKNGYIQTKSIIIRPDSVTESDWELGYVVKKRFPKKNTCLAESKMYAELLKNAKVMSNGHHAFVVKDGKVYDSTHMEFTGFLITTDCVKNYYGEALTWKEKE